MAVKSTKKKPVSVKSDLSNKLKSLKEKKILLTLLIVLFLLMLGAIKLTQPRYSDPKGPSVHKTEDGTVVLEDGTVVKSDPEAPATVAAKQEEKKKAAAAASTGSTGASAGSSASSGGSSTPAPVAEEFSIGPPFGQVDENYVCGAGHTFNFTATITSNGAGSITYQWAFSDGATIPGSLTFTGASTRQLTTSWTLGQQNYYGWARLEVLTPFETASKADDADFTMDAICT